MVFNLQPNSGEPESLDHGPDAERSFQVSPEPVIAESRNLAETDGGGLPRSYGLETLCLMARDPHTLFAYWDVDWVRAFGEATPKQRKVFLRVLNADESEHTSVEVEPLAGNGYVTVAEADAAYHGDIGYFDPLGVWTAVARSERVVVPPEKHGDGEPADFATVPFHLSFQRMVDALRGAREENESLVGMLSNLRHRVAAAEEKQAITAQQLDLARAIEAAVAEEPAKAQSSASPDLWTQHGLEKIFGFGNSSLNGGFGGSSRS